MPTRLSEATAGRKPGPRVPNSASPRPLGLSLDRQPRHRKEPTGRVSLSLRAGRLSYNSYATCIAGACSSSAGPARARDSRARSRSGSRPAVRPPPPRTLSRRPGSRYAADEVVEQPASSGGSGRIDVDAEPREALPALERLDPAVQPCGRIANEALGRSRETHEPRATMRELRGCLFSSGEADTQRLRSIGRVSEGSATRVRARRPQGGV